MEYGRRDGNHGRLPVKVNVCLEEFCNIGKLVDFKRVLEVCRGSNIFCQLIVQSIPQLKGPLPKDGMGRTDRLYRHPDLPRLQ